jgi:hypothetical protein
MTSPLSTKLTSEELNEEIAFFRDYCGWSDKRIEERLALADGTLARRHQARKPKRTRGN